MSAAIKWPPVENPTYVRDRLGVIWLLDPIYSETVAVTATSHGQFSVSTTILRDLRGPLHILTTLGTIVNEFPTMDPEPQLTKPVQEVLARTEEEAKNLG